MRYYEFDASENISEIHVAKLGEPLDAPEEKVDIKSTFSSNEKTFAYLYGYNNGTYDLLDECFILSSQILVVPENSGYSKFYVVVCNGNLAEDHKDLQYTIRFDGKIVETGEDNSNDKVFDTDISNYHVKITTDMTAVGVQTQTISEGTVDEVHQKEHLVNVTNAMGMDIETEIYTNYATGVSYTKIPFTGQWEKSNDGSQTVKMSTVLEQFEKKGKVEQVSANCYKVTLPVKSLTGTIKGQSGTSLAFTKDEVTSYVYTSGKYITRMELDYSDAVTIMDKLVIVIEFSNYNKEGDVVFPSNLK